MKLNRSLTELKILIVAVILFGMTSPEMAWAQKKSNRPVPVGVAKAVELSSQNKIKLPGTVIPWSTTRLAAEVDGRVEKLLFNEGDYIKKGTPLVKIRTEPLILQRNRAISQKRLVETRLAALRYRPSDRQEWTSQARSSFGTPRHRESSQDADK